MTYLLLFWIHWIHVCCLIFFFGCCWTAPWPKQWEHAGFFTSSKFEANRYGSSAGYHWACHHSWCWPTYLRNFGRALSQVWDKRQKIRIMHATPRCTSACTLGLPTDRTDSQLRYGESARICWQWHCNSTSLELPIALHSDVLITMGELKRSYYECVKRCWGMATGIYHTKIERHFPGCSTYCWSD